MQLAEPVRASWRAALSLSFASREGRTVMAQNLSQGPLVVQKPLYPEGPDVCHAIVVHPPGGIVGGDELLLSCAVGSEANVLLTTPGAGKWYRSAGPWAQQKLAFEVQGTLEWLPRETIVFDGALGRLECEVRLGAQARYLGWEIVCLGRTGSGERFERGEVGLDTRVVRDGKPLWLERGKLQAAARLMRSAVGLAGHSVFGTLLAAAPAFDAALVNECRQFAAVTRVPGLLVARYLGDSTEEAFERFTSVWSLLRPAVTGRAPVVPRIWRT